MKMRAVLLSTLACLGMCSIAHAQTPDVACAPDAQIMMLQDAETFDASGRGWRRLLQQEGCEGAAVALIDRYIAFQGKMLGPVELSALHWHQGLLEARLGKSPEALKLMAAARAAPETPDYTAAYMDATIAFLKHDRPALEKARGALAAVPKPADYDAQAAEYTNATGRAAPPWPPNLDAVDALLKCFDRPYREAQSDPACRT